MGEVMDAQGAARRRHVVTVKVVTKVRKPDGVLKKEDKTD